MDGRNHEQDSPGSNEATDVGDGLVSGRIRQRLDSDHLGDEVKTMYPLEREIEKISADIANRRSGKAFASEPDSGLGDVKADGVAP
jgi:hypothetical protein